MSNENSAKTNINWYPGHMVKAKKEIIDSLKLIDVVIELLDARIPLSSRNPDIDKIISNKKRIVVLNKSDLSDDAENKKWVEYFKQNNQTAILVNSVTGDGIQNVLKKIEVMCKQEVEEYLQKGKGNKTIRIMILGIPNVGKSSFINRISKKSPTIVGNKPGVTKQKQWIRVNNNIELLDTPGVLWPKIEEEQTGLNLAFTGTIKDEVLEKTEIAYYLTKFLYENEKEKLEARYKLETDKISDENKILAIIEQIARKRGALVSGGNVDEERVANIIIEDFRSGKLGKISIEKVG